MSQYGFASLNMRRGGREIESHNVRSSLFPHKIQVGQFFSSLTTVIVIYFVGDYLTNPWTSEATCFRDRKLVSPYYLKLCFILPNHSLSALEAPADLGVGPQEVVCYYRYCRCFFFFKSNPQYEYYKRSFPKYKKKCLLIFLYILFDEQTPRSKICI